MQRTPMEDQSMGVLLDYLSNDSGLTILIILNSLKIYSLAPFGHIYITGNLE